jgi:uncharacterized protein YeaO (DUF488 family)
MQMSIELKRVYDPASESDGYRILVDRLWPRGLTEESARVDLWLRRIAPTTELRKWYRHDVEKWPEFQKRYESELAAHGELLDLILDIERHRKIVTILFGAKDVEHNEANVVLTVLKRGQSRRTHVRGAG